MIKESVHLKKSSWPLLNFFKRKCEKKNNNKKKNICRDLKVSCRQGCICAVSENMTSLAKSPLGHYFWKVYLISGPETHTLPPWTQ